MSALCNILDHISFYFQMLGLTKETFLALRQTCRGITGLAKYLINYCDFKYVLLGKIQSDTIEGRFGRIRQLSGAKYYISMRQLLESDRKLRTLSLVKYSRIFISHIDQVAKSTKNVENELLQKQNHSMDTSNLIFCQQTMMC